MTSPLTRADVERLLAEAVAGPWEANESDSDRYQSWVAGRYLNGEPDSVALVGYSNLDEQNGNARLIAAAPDLARQLLASMEENEKTREALAVARPLIYEGMSCHVEGRYAEDWNKRSDIFLDMMDALPSPPSPKG